MKTKHLRFVFVALAATALASAQTIDQSFDPANANFSFGLSNTHPAAQTFTVGASGLLSSFAVEVSGVNVSDQLFWDIRNTTGGVPTTSDSVTLAAGSVASSALPPDFGTFFAFDVSAFNILVNSGDVLAITLRGTTGSWYGRTDDGYVPGRLFDGVPSSGSTPWSAFGDMDLAFSTSVAAVPEPSTYAALLGLAALGFAVWRNRVNQAQKRSLLQ